jgi:peptidyl-prolyl cis-trans isomerase D
MREIAPTIMIIVLVSFVIGTIFFNWGMNAGGSKNKSSYAGTINGKEIPLSSFDREVNAQRQKLQENGAEVPPYQYHMVPRQVWEQEVQRVLTQEIIDKLKLGATADEVFEYIKHNPLPGIDTASLFQKNGKFDTSEYVKYLNDPKNYGPQSWLLNVEEYTRQTIVPSQKLEKLLSAGALPTNAEIEYEYDQNQSKVMFEYAKVNNFMQPVDTTKITNAEIEKYYTAHRDSFNEDNQVELYFAKFPKVATFADDTSYFHQLVELKKKVMESPKRAETFAEEAKLESDEDGSAQNGGDIGWISKGQSRSPEFDSATFSADTGTVVGPIRTQMGYQLVYIDAKELKDGQAKVKARLILKKIVPTIETLDLLSADADSLRSLMSDKGFVTAAKSFKNVQFDSTGLFKKGDMIPKIGYISGAGQFIYGNDKNDISERLENNEGFFLLTVKQRTKKGIISLNAAKARILPVLADSLRKTASKEYLIALKQKLNDSSSIAALKDSDPKIMSGKSDSIPVNGFVAGIGSGSKVAAVAYSLPIGKISNPIEYEGSYYVVKTIWKQAPGKIDISSPQAMQISEQIKMKNLQRMYYGWFMDYKNKAKIKSNIDNLYLD